MSDLRLDTRLRSRRRAAGLSQTALAERTGVSRQAIVAIEGGRNAPSTMLSLRLARALECRVEDIFHLTPPDVLQARLAPEADGCGGSERVALARVAGEWVAHRLPSAGAEAADGVLVSHTDTQASVSPLFSEAKLARGVLVAGSAPLLGVAASRANRRFADLQARWLPSGNRRALELLADGFVHIAGLQLEGDDGPDAAIAAAKGALPSRHLRTVQLTKWHQALVLPAESADAPPVSRVLETLADPEFGSDADRMPATIDP